MFRRFAGCFKKLRNLKPLRFLLPIGLIHLLPTAVFTTSQPPINVSPPSLEIEVLSKFEMKESDLHKHLIVYQKVGHAKTDELALDLLEIYRDLFGNDNMRILVLEPGATDFEEMPAGLTVIRRYSRDVQFVDFARWGNKAGSLEQFYSLVMKQVNKRLEEMPAFSSSNLEKLPEVVKPDKDIVLVMRTDRNSPNYIRERMSMETFRQKTQILARDPAFLVVEDEQAASALGLGQVKQGGISLLVPLNSENLKQSKNCKEVEYGGVKYCLREDAQNSKLIKESFVFAPYLTEHPAYYLKLLINFNKINSRYLKQLYETFRNSELEYPVKLIPTNDNDGFAIELEKYDADSEWILLEKTPKKPLTAEEKTAILTSPKTWRYAEAGVTSEQLKSWVQRVKSGAQPPYLHCERERPYERYSNKLVGSTFGEILQSPNDELVFYYSRNCASCKRFGKQYELLANQYKQRGSTVLFNRLDNDKNKTSQGFNYNYTPVFAYFKKGHKQRPFIYKRPYFTEQYFRDFIELTGQIRIIDEQPFNEAVEAAKAFL